MDRIVIEVDETTARKWKLASDEAKRNAFRKISAILNYTLDKDDNELTVFQDKISKEAKQNGLTLEVFQDIMELDDQTMKNLFGEEYQPRQ
jgi:hypothetical protein